ncbi:MAG: cell wall metabolism sensor histidine kinase WalK [Lachnospiraceae bacterium]|nr:cell wall metabolism sensor histidine kinase WalK [Lachnospiraceae bacterium]
MKRSLTFKLILCYIILISLIYFTVNMVCSITLDNYVDNNYNIELSNTANTIIEENTMSAYFSGEMEKEDFLTFSQRLDELISPYLWVVDLSGNIIYGSSEILIEPESVNLISVDHDIFKKTYYKEMYYPSIMKFQCLTTIRQIFDNEKQLRGYIVLLVPHDTITNKYDDNVIQINIVTLIAFPITAIVFILIYFLTIQPIHRITKYSVEYSKGKFSGKIVIKSNDELKQLADAINYMVSELNNLDEYQRKFIGNISHDFRSPLTSIKGYVEAMLDGTIPLENHEKYLKIILFESERLTGLTTNLLTLNNFDNNKRMLDKKVFDINEIIAKTTEVYEGRCSKNKIDLEKNFENKEQPVYADQSQIQQVINNLLDNAIKFSPQYSKIILSTYTKNEKIFVSIKDFGTGIPKNSINRIWERFYKTDPSRGKDKKGTGLGLAITKEIINAHHENINVVSTEGVGTEFIFSLSKPNQ